MSKHPSEMNDGEYDAWIKAQPTTQRMIMSVLRESRYVSAWFPPYSSGAGDAIDLLIKDLRREWGLPVDEDKDYWYA